MADSDAGSEYSDDYPFVENVFEGLSDEEKVLVDATGPSIKRSNLLEKCLKLCFDAREFYVPTGNVERASGLTPIELLRDYISRNIPVVIVDAAAGWPAKKEWNEEYLLKKIGNLDISVECTPNGRADAILEFKGKQYFVEPETRTMKFRDFVSAVKSQPTKQPAAEEAHDVLEGEVLYISHQNSSLTEEFRPLLQDIGKPTPSASASEDYSFSLSSAAYPLFDDALARSPEAINLWIGTGASITSGHSDPYENAYTVIKGSKQFYLHPPCDHPFLYRQPYKRASYKKVSGEGECPKYQVVECGEEEERAQVPWVSVDFARPDYEKFPLYKHVKPIVVDLKPGETLYLPSLWFHQVEQQQEGVTIAVNAWYDMDYSHRFVGQEFLRNISAMTGISIQ